MAKEQYFRKQADQSNNRRVSFDPSTKDPVSEQACMGMGFSTGANANVGCYGVNGHVGFGHGNEHCHCNGYQPPPGKY